MESTANQLYVIWQDNKTRLRYVIGELIRENNYRFQYMIKNIQTLKPLGFNRLTAFPDLDKTYSSDSLFSAFSSRLPDKRRSDINEILNNYEMGKYDEFELLKKSGGRLPTDYLEFVEPIDLSNEVINRRFYIAGTKYFFENNRGAILALQPGMVLSCQLQTDNDYDEYAVQILNNDKVIGYVPSYFSQPVTEAVKAKRKVSITVLEVKPVVNDNWHEYARVELVITGTERK